MLLHWIWLATRPSVNDRLKMALLQHFHDPEDVFYAEKGALEQVEGMTQEALEALQEKDTKPAQAIIKDCAGKDIRICTFHDAAYPARLKNISDPPMVLYYKGNLPDLDSVPAIAVVGTRGATAYGLNAAKRLGGQIAKCGGIVVSGLAAGIDGAAISGALSAGGTVVGVLGSGADVVYPLKNRGLFADTQRYGCLLSEFVPGTPPMKWNFPKRNRIISGMSCGVLVVEAPEKSGALITARCAADQGRDVFVVPGNIDVPTFVGSNRLLRDGAIAVSSGWDVMSEYAAQYPDKITEFAGKPEKIQPKVAQNAPLFGNSQASKHKEDKKVIDNGEASPYSGLKDKRPQLLPDEQKILSALTKEARSIDDVIAETGIPTARMLATLTLLQVK